MNQPEHQSDEELASSLVRGDASASATLTQRYSSSIYDFALRVTLDPATASSATENTLRRLSRDIAGRSEGVAFASWLLGIAREESLDGLRARSRGENGDETREDALDATDQRFVQVDDPEVEEAATWAWQAARLQRPRDYSILDLLLRRKVAPEDIASIASLSPNGVYAVLGRLRGAFEESYAATALFSTGREACQDLEAAIGNKPSLTPAVRREIARHAEACEVCREARSNMPQAAELFAGLKPVEMPGDLSDHLLPMMLAAPVAPYQAPETAPDADEPDKEAEDEPTATSDELETPSAAVLFAAATLPENGDSIDQAEGEAGARPDDAEAAAEPSTPFQLPGEDTLAPEPELPAFMRPSAPGEAATNVDDESTSTASVEQSPDVAELENASNAEEKAATPPRRRSRLPTPVSAGESVPSAEHGTLEEETAELPALLSSSPVGGRKEQPRPARQRVARAGGTLVVTGASDPQPFRMTPEDDRRNSRTFFLYALTAVLTLVALYLGVAVGDSLQGGGADGAEPTDAPTVLPTRVADAANASCAGPVSVGQGGRVSLVFGTIPSGLEIVANPVVQPVSAASSLTQVNAVAQADNTVLFTAASIPNSPGRSDQYRVTATFQRGNERQTAECTVNVLGPAAGTPAGAATATPRP